ncbi:asparagine synthase (glutamine-hydrolyzing) [Streptomyces sp. NBC_00365]|uniref:asparagine synthase (glutamine-hydrolyzing) n=1 Tax=Streptomyces sp. NBC_00365 TaxID=2975726 RepID=UPI002252944A|nr:asparagine synthase (glutamine-hydrolyzing) [Streptomyces sp. NBC_00365]MCX5090342.1 asparagine synthase (glutamine-hydrolyzing) [Streptomyces sp. NBC_00365]
MCGFVVVLNRGAAGCDPCTTIEHRGPDSSGHQDLHGPDWHASLHFRRLAIVDVGPRSDQPFGDAERGFLVYNGEIYNVPQMRSTLRSRGVRFTTEGDTEVLYELLLQPDAAGLLGQVDGMFAFVQVLPDGQVRYGRDRLGIKPLYVASDASGGVVALASEVAPLRAIGLADHVDPVAVAQGAMFLWTPPPRTGWLGVRAAPIGSVHCLRPPRYARPRLVWQAEDTAPAQDIGEAVRESVRRQVRADVPVGLLLSGGVDSTWLGVELHRAGFSGPVFSAREALPREGSAEPFEGDAPYAERVARRLGVPPHWVDLDVDVLRQIPEMVSAMELPFGDPAAIALMRLARAARDEATVLLSGVGVEEIFLGYERYQAVRMLQRIPASGRLLLGRASAGPVPGRFRERVDKLGRMCVLGPRDWAWGSQAYFSPEEWAQLSLKVELDEVTAAHRDIVDPLLAAGASPLSAVAECDRRLFLPGLNLLYADRASMRASVELRVPFLGEPVIASALAVRAEDQLRPGNGKARFRAAASAAGVPDFVTRRSKTGFGAPVRSLLRQHGRHLWSRVRQAGIFDELLDRRTADCFVSEHVSGERERGLAVFGLFCAAMWWERNVDGDGRVEEALQGYRAAAP